MRRGDRSSTALWALLAFACGDDGGGDSASSSATVNPETGDSGSTTAGTSTSTTAGSTGSSGDTGPIFDVGMLMDVGGPGDVCKVQDGGSGVGTCRQSAPPDSFEPDIQWEWTGMVGDQAVSTPLVANLTDDNDDGVIDLCDVPDVVAVVSPGLFGMAHITVLDGATGAEHYSTPELAQWTVTPAIGDIDDDGIPEIITIGGDLGQTGNVIAFEHDGTMKWMSPNDAGSVQFGGVALADLDADGEVEILAGDVVFDSSGVELWDSNGAGVTNGVGSVATAADLDDDGDLEVIYGNVAYHHDGTLYYDNVGMVAGLPQVGDLDGDGLPEVLLMNQNGINVLEHDGTTKFADSRPTGDPNSPWTVWFKPAAIHDFDADGISEMATGSSNNFTTYEIEAAGATIIWQAPVLDASGSAGGTAFDFDGDALAEAMYADETTMFVFDGQGQPLLTTPRQSGTGLEYPVVADVDNDGSAEIVVVSNFQNANDPSPTVQVIRDIQDRWIQARRIWNQHTYHVTNVREDGTIPEVEPQHWKQLNTFRTNAQIEGGVVCQPEG